LILLAVCALPATAQAQDMAITSGLVTIHDLSKRFDYLLPALAFMLAGVWLWKQPVIDDWRPSIPRLPQYCGALLTGYLGFGIGAAVFTAPAPRIAFALIFAAIAIWALRRQPMSAPTSIPKIGLKVGFGVGMLAVANFKIFCNGGGAISHLLATLATLALLIYTRPAFLVCWLAIVVVKRLDFGAFVIDDPFHRAEAFLSYAAGFAPGQHTWNIFPNVGWIEEALPNFVVDSISTVTQHTATITLQEAHTWLALALLYFVYRLLDERNALLSVLLALTFPTSRLSLLVVTAMGLAIVMRPRIRLITYGTLAAAPLLMLGLSPSYSAILIFAWGLHFWQNQVETRAVAVSAVIAGLLLWATAPWLSGFLDLYRSWAEVNVPAHGIPLIQSGLYHNAVRSIFMFAVSISIWTAALSRQTTSWTKWPALAGLIASLVMVVSYAFTRIDHDTATRILPMGLSLFVLSYAATSKPHLRWALLTALLALYGAKFASLRHEDYSQPFMQRERMTLSVSNKKRVDDIIAARPLPAQPLVFFGLEPALAAFIPQTVVPPLTSPWVTVGGVAQQRVIAFLEGHPDSPIYLGSEFARVGSFDGVDMRARAPQVFRYINNHYNVTRIADFWFAIPTKSTPHSSAAFNGFDIGSAAAFYERNGLPAQQTVSVVRSCPTALPTAPFIVNNADNWLIANLACGDNAIPREYMMGANIGIRPLTSASQIPVKQ
jgi:hypothetical protein